ncbi:MAG: alpha/beta fold hydrolase [Mycobacteriales bacterium]
MRARNIAMLGAAVAAGLVAGQTVERTTVRAHRQRPDPAARERLGALPPDRTRTVLTDDGVALHVEEVGPIDAPLTIVFAHGWTLTRACWHYQRRDLADPGVRLVFYDQRGHGSSGRPDLDSCTIERFGADLAEVLAACAAEGPVVLVGHSMGGMTIMALAADHPELFGVGGRVAGVALLSTSAGRVAEVTLGLPAALARLTQRGAPQLWRQLTRHGDRLESRRLGGTDLVFGVLKRVSFGGDVPPSLVELMESMIDQTPLAVMAACASALLNHDKLAALAVLRDTPTLVLVGEADLLTPPGQSQEIADQLPDADLVVLPGAGHMVGLERPGLVNLHLRTLLSRAGLPRQPA